jgi:hypothetical protein
VNEPSTVLAMPISAYDRPVTAWSNHTPSTKGRVLDEAEQCRLRGHKATTCLFLGQIVQRVMQDNSVLVDDFVDALAVLGGPLRSLLLRHRYTL